MLVVNPCIVSKWSSVYLLGRPAVWNKALDTRKEKAAEPGRKGWEAATAGCVFSSLLQRRWWRRESLVVCHKNTPEKVSTSVYQVIPYFALFLMIPFMLMMTFCTFEYPRFVPSSVSFIAVAPVSSFLLGRIYPSPSVLQHS